LRETLSNEETPITAAAIAPSTTPPATIESKVFFKEGVTAASATKGEETEETTAAESAAVAFVFAFSSLARTI
jgi:hypothetical protein|tara:strand:- start:5349 stop:5567 length:219 start_codon:yes stop_codon:yes gene_type:complete